MIRRLLFSQQRPLQLVFTWLGAFTGFLMLVGAVQYYLDFKELLMVKNDWLHPEYLVVNKPVSLIHTLSGKSSTFSENEIQELRQVGGVEEIGVFGSNRFKARADMMQGAGSNPVNMYADLFFESLPDKFLDVKSESWKWKEGDEVIPVIIPADYLRLYNFGFAPSQQLPQISEKTMEAISFGIRIDSQGTAIHFRGKIAGFSNRINSILVPLSFLQYANARYGAAGEAGPARIVLVVKDPANAALLSFLDSKGYETNSEQLRNARLSSFLRIVLSMLLGVGGVIVFLALLGFVQYTQLAVYRASYEIKTLVDIGYRPSRLVRFYNGYAFLLLGSMLVLSVGVLWLIKSYTTPWIENMGFALTPGLRTETLLEALCIFALFLVIQLITIRRSIYSLATAKK